MWFFFPEVLPSLPVCLYQEVVDQEITLATLPPPPTRDTHTHTHTHTHSLRHTRNSLFSPKQTAFLYEPDSSPASIWSTFRFGRNQKPPLLTFWTAFISLDFSFLYPRVFVCFSNFQLFSSILSLIKNKFKYIFTYVYMYYF